MNPDEIQHGPTDAEPDISDRAHEGLPVGGYQPQSDKNVERVNKNKLLEEGLLRCLDFLIETGDHDRRFLAIAQTHFEEGFMAMNRAIFQPQRIDGDLPIAHDETAPVEFPEPPCVHTFEYDMATDTRICAKCGAHAEADVRR